MKITLKAARVNAGMTQTEVGAKLGCARSTITSWEQGKTSPRADVLVRLCRLYDVPIERIKTKE